MTKNNLPYKECEKCTDLKDCAHPDVADDMLGSPLPPDGCPQKNYVMKQTEKRIKHERDINRVSKTIRD